MNKIINDDQAALYYIYFDWLENKRNTCPFTVDYSQKIFGTIARNDSCAACNKSPRQPLEQWNFDDMKNCYESVKTKNFTCIATLNP